MTLEEGKRLLTEAGIPFVQLDFETESAYWDAVCCWSSGNPGREEPVTVFRIEAPNGRRHLDLQFLGGALEDLWFGGFSYELWENTEESLPGVLLECVRSVMEEGCWCVIRVDAERGLWRGDALSCPEENSMGACLEKLARPRTIWERLFQSRRRYEVYDWNEYHCIER